MKKAYIIITVIVVAGLAFYFGTWFSSNQSFPQTATSTIQTATTTEVGTDSDGMDDEHEFLQADYNFDGYSDRLKMLDCGATGNCSYEVDLYDPKTKEYLPVADGEMSFEVTNPVVSKEEQLVCSYANIGAGSYHLTVYRYATSAKGFVQVKEFSGSTEKIHKCSLK